MASITGIENGTQAPTAAPTRRTLDVATLVGLVGGFVLVGVAIALGGELRAFFDLPSILIVLGGTFAVTTISFSLPEVIRAQPLMLRAVFSTTPDPVAAIQRIVGLADVARRRGLLVLQDRMDELQDDPFLRRAITLVVDGTAPEEIERILNTELAATAARHAKSAGVLRRASEVAPAMGLIGTLIGLVQMLGHIDNPRSIGPSMAIALMTTFYGALLANMVFAPLASKLERNAAIESLVGQIFAVGAAAIARQENPRRLELLLNTALPPSERTQQFE